jgi:hypothetical protein
VNICDAQKALGSEVRDYLCNVPGANEESITDYLVWKWRELDRKFNYVRVETHTHHKESTTSGADFEMELWLVGRAFSLPLLFQAKKLVKPYDGYVRRLRYPNGSKKQLRLLLKYAKQTRRIPFYALYAIPDHTGSPFCPCGGAADGGVFVVHAHIIRRFANGQHGKKVSKGALLGAGTPFYCWFCCSGFLVDWLNGTLKAFAPELRPLLRTSDLPGYARALLHNTRGEERSQAHPARLDEGPHVRRIGVYDLRDVEGLPVRW